MAKELPYFKFEPNSWENGNIQMCSFETKGLFIDLCVIYWSRLGDLPEKLAIQKVCGGNASALDSLYEENIIELKDNYISISFLNEQLIGFEDTSKQNSENARKGWEKRRKAKQSDRNASALDPQSESYAIREEKRREDERREEKIKELFDRFWNLYDKKTSREKCFKKFSSLKPQEMEQLFIHVPNYVKSTPDKKYRKDPTTYLNNKSFNDEIITFQKQQENESFSQKFFKGTNPEIY